MKDSMCKTCAHYDVGWDMHSRCAKEVVETDEYRSCEEGCPKYKQKTKGGAK